MICVLTTAAQPAQPTTTLQALVNLKRPTLRLSPLTNDPGHHAIEFEYSIHISAEHTLENVVTAQIALGVMSSGFTLAQDLGGTIDLKRIQIAIAPRTGQRPGYWWNLSLELSYPLFET